MGRDLDSADAKRFLISRVIAEAELEHVPLLDVEKKMLAFRSQIPRLPKTSKKLTVTSSASVTPMSMKTKSPNS